jgi:hypothetical protein
MSKYLTLRLNRFVPSGLLALAAAALLAPAAANATPYVIKLVQQGSNVIAMGSGAFDVSGLTSVSLSNQAGMSPSYGAIVVGNASAGLTLYYPSFSGPVSFGAGGVAFASSKSGDVGAISIGAGVLGAPIGYVSGTNLSGTATWDNATFASLGVTPGTYVWTWGTAAEQSFTLDVANSVPEPAALSIFGFGVLLTGAFMGLRRRVA